MPLGISTAVLSRIEPFPVAIPALIFMIIYVPSIFD